MMSAEKYHAQMILNKDREVYHEIGNSESFQYCRGEKSISIIEASFDLEQYKTVTAKRVSVCKFKTYNRNEV